MTSEERASIDNGIWMCQTHGKLIDTDESRFSISMLKHWRGLAERRAQLEQELGRSIELPSRELSGVSLAENAVSLRGRGEENRVIGDALHDSCLSVVWGAELADAIRDATIEIARNGFDHGGASAFEIRVEPSVVRLVEDGRHFVPWRLPAFAGGRGGAAAVRYLLDTHGEHIVVESRRVAETTEHSIALATPTLDIGAVTPCVATFSFNEEHDAVAHLDILESCDTVYALVHDYGTYSDLEDMLDALAALVDDGRERTIAFVVSRVSAGVIRALSIMARSRFPSYRFVKIP